MATFNAVGLSDNAVSFQLQQGKKMKFKYSLIAVALGLGMAGAQAAEGHTQWGYTGHGAPENWGKLSPEFAACASGKSQSPINIVDAIKGELPANKVNYRPSKVVVENNGHTIQANYSDSNNTLRIGDKVYTLKQFHFHVPSENMIKGKSFPLEAHFVHADAKGNLAVLGVLYEDGKANSRLAPIWQAMPQKGGQKTALKQQFDAATLLPASLDYYRFSGSLTTPPCSEGVNWLVLKTYDHIGKEQVEQFRRVMGGHNNRPVQPVNARVVVQ